MEYRSACSWGNAMMLIGILKPDIGRSRLHFISAGILITWISTFVLVLSCTRQPIAPILVLGNISGFGLYTCEVLKAEGFNEFVADSMNGDRIVPRYLRRFDLVILGESTVSPRQKKMLEEYVIKGGSLIAFRPDKALSDLFGILPDGTHVSDGYIKIDTGTGPGKGLISETMQFHGQADVCMLAGGKEIARLFRDSRMDSGSPAVVISKQGKGYSAAFTYNLPESIVLTRQGNPEWAGEERDHIDGPTATDLFFPGENEKQWNDPERISIPQADEQMRLLTHIIEQLTAEEKPLPRFWYFPDNLKCVLIFTIDGEDTPEGAIKEEFADLAAKGANATLYEIGIYISAATVEKWRAGGNEVSVHYNDVPHYASPDYQNMSEVYERMTREFTSAYGLKPETSRNHWVVWCSRDPGGGTEFAEQAIIEERSGIQFDCNYYQFGGNNVYPNFLGDVGHFTGSGIPMRFADSKGHIIDVFQSNTQLPDETWLKANVESKGKTLIDRSLDEENYTWINTNFHTWYWPECREAGLNIVDYCNSRGVPVFTAERANNFIRAKDEAKFTDITWKNKTLSFKVISTRSSKDRLTVIVPVVTGRFAISDITVDGRQANYARVGIKGFQYASVSVNPGAVHSFSAIYN